MKTHFKSWNYVFSPKLVLGYLFITLRQCSISRRSLREQVPAGKSARHRIGRGSSAIKLHLRGPYHTESRLVSKLNLVFSTELVSLAISATLMMPGISWHPEYLVISVKPQNLLGICWFLPTVPRDVPSVISEISARALPCAQGTCTLGSWISRAHLSQMIEHGFSEQVHRTNVEILSSWIPF